MSEYNAWGEDYKILKREMYAAKLQDIKAEARKMGFFTDKTSRDETDQKDPKEMFAQTHWSERAQVTIKLFGIVPMEYYKRARSEMPLRLNQQLDLSLRQPAWTDDKYRIVEPADDPHWYAILKEAFELASDLYPANDHPYN